MISIIAVDFGGFHRNTLFNMFRVIAISMTIVGMLDTVQSRMIHDRPVTQTSLAGLPLNSL